MILLDTNVISEMMKDSPAPTVQAWLDAQMPETLFLSSVTVAELTFGVGVMPEGRRKIALSAALQKIMDLFRDRVLLFDTDAAAFYARLAVAARAAGKGFPTPDGYIAAIAASRGFAVASRDYGAFVAAGLPLIDPWTARG